jgi:hypothetical protein
MNVLRTIGKTIVATGGALALTPIYVAEKTCKAGEVTSRGVKNAAAWSEKKCANGVEHMQAANTSVSALAEEKQILVDIKTARTLDELPKSKKLDKRTKAHYSSAVIDAYHDKREELEAKAKEAADAALAEAAVASA